MSCKFGKIFDGKEWTSRTVEEILTEIEGKKSCDIKEILSTKFDLPEETIQKIEEGLDSLRYTEDEYDNAPENKKETKKKRKLRQFIRDELRLILYNNRNVVLKNNINK